jgi:hypothetical protein
VGRSAPDFELLDGTKLGELLRNGKGLLLDFDVSGPFEALASRWSGKVTYVASDAKDRLAHIAFGSNRNRHCERSEAIQGNVRRARSLDCFVAALLAMTIPSERSAP